MKSQEEKLEAMNDDGQSPPVPFNSAEYEDDDAVENKAKETGVLDDDRNSIPPPVPFNSTEYEDDAIAKKVKDTGDVLDNNRDSKVSCDENHQMEVATTISDTEESNHSTVIVDDATTYSHISNTQNELPILEATLVPDMPVYEASLVVEEVVDDTGIEERGEETNNKSAKNTQELSDMVVKAAKNSRRVNKAASNLTQLNLIDMKLYGREEDMKLLRSKLLALKNRADATETMPELVLISGVSGTGKSSLAMKGVKYPAEKMGMTFVCGKFDLNNASIPLSAFSYAMASLTRSIIEGDMKMKKKILDGITEHFDDKDMALISKAVSCSLHLLCISYVYHASTHISHTPNNTYLTVAWMQQAIFTTKR